MRKTTKIMTMWHLLESVPNKHVITDNKTPNGWLLFETKPAVFKHTKHIVQYFHHEQ